MHFKSLHFHFIHSLAYSLSSFSWYYRVKVTRYRGNYRSNRDTIAVIVARRHCEYSLYLTFIIGSPNS